MKFNQDQKQLLQNMYSESRSFEDFGDKVCFAIMHDELPQIDTVDIVGGFCSVKSDSYEISFKQEDSSWATGMERDMSIDVPKEIDLITHMRQNHNYYFPPRETVADVVNSEIREVEIGDGLGVEQYEKKLHKLLEERLKNIDIPLTSYEKDLCRQQAMEEYNRIAERVVADSQIALERTDSLIKIVREDLATYEEAHKQYEEKGYPARRELERLQEAEAKVLLDLKHMKDNYSISVGEINSDTVFIGQQPSILEEAAKSIVKDIDKELHWQVEDDKEPSALELAEKEDNVKDDVAKDMDFAMDI